MNARTCPAVAESRYAAAKSRWPHSPIGLLRDFDANRLIRPEAAS
jgi:hypothetical protein